MKQKTAIIVIINIILASLQFHTEAESRLEMRHLHKESFKSAEHSDSTDNIMKMSNEGSGSLIDGVIPMSPQAASLARYAEYPVSHTTGIPDITIPLYEIRLGGFSLPISISYHASGARPDEVPTCVGLGWTLNAGGAVTRNILGGPDLEVSDMNSGDYSFYRMSRIDSLIDDVRNRRVDGPLRELINPRHYRDSESDRYCFNAGGHTGVFRYSYKDRKYICLDRSSCILESFGYGDSSYFIMYCPDNTKYRFSIHEKTGPDPEQEDPRFTTAWYVSQIHTPYGDIDFTYRSLDDRFYVRHTNTYYRSGYYPRHQKSENYNAPDYNYDEFDIKKHENSETNMYYCQKLVSSIKWNGNTMDFEYADGSSDDLNMRLKKISVRSSDGTILKTIDFGNEIPWSYGTEKGRRVLSSLDDSSAGTYTFTYYTDGRLPNVIQFGNPPRYTDSWGYYNGGDGPVLSKDIADWLRIDHNDELQAANTYWRDRSPKLEYARLGVLKSITFPTGGSVSYTYELNELDGVRYGGLRVASTSLVQGGTSITKTFGYTKGVLPQMPPDSLSKHLSYLRISNIFDKTRPRTLQYRTAYSSPIFSPFSKSAPVLYTEVTEKLSDGRYTVYEYDPLENFVYPDRMDWSHPSSYPEAITDRGHNEPVLKVKSTYSAEGGLLRRETNTYRSRELARIETGVRLISVIDFYRYEGGDEGHEEPEDEFPEGVGYQQLLKCQTTARQIATVLESTSTEDFTTGFSSSVSYTYDALYRTLRPVTETTVNSDGKRHVIEYEYPFNRSGEFYKSMEEDGYVDWILSTSKYSDDRLIARDETEYEDVDGIKFTWILPTVLRSWSAPTASSLLSPPAVIPERERAGSYNAMGRPLSVVVNATDTTAFAWDSSGTLLLSATAPGGLKTAYTHKPLFGVSSITLPNGHRTSYSYNSAGMLVSEQDTKGKLAGYSYSLSNHSVPSMTGNGNAVTSVRYLDGAGTRSVSTRQYYGGLGQPSTLVTGGLNTSGKYVFSTVGYDALGRQCAEVLPGAGGTSLGFRSYSDVVALSEATNGDACTVAQTAFDALDRPVKVLTPGQAWRDLWKARHTEYVSNAAGSVRLYSAPMDAISLVENGYYAAGTLQGVRYVDEDGKEMTVYTDRLGRKVLERRGPENKKGMNDTYFVYNALGQLRYVLTPGYELSGYKDRFAYEYRYDDQGNVVKKFIPDAGYTQYWYDRAGRLSFMQDPNLREAGLYRFYVYDRAGRPAIQGVAALCTRGQEVNLADYTGGTTGFLETGYTLADASRLRQVTLECVSYYDGYGFAGTYDPRLSKTGTASAKGLQTGAVVYSSDGSRSVSASYYDIRGNVTETRELTAFGTLRVTENTYTYSGQPLTSKMTEGSVTLLTENGYHADSGLLQYTDVTVNGKRQRVSAVTYDDLGRIASVTRGAALNSGGTVRYTYNLHGQTDSITGPGFSQTLHYADGPGTKLYNGSVSAMSWTMGADATQRGYKFKYNDYNWLTAAEYGEGASLTANRDRYTERTTEFMRNGGIRRLQRHGLKADGNYGKIDNLHIYYTGNRVTGVLEDADPVTTNGSMDYAGTTGSVMAVEYNEWGAMTKDEARGITSVTYDRLGNPSKVSFSSPRGSYADFVYSATGERLKATHYTSPIFQGGVAEVSYLTDYGSNASPSGIDPGLLEIAGLTKLEYHGPVVYRNGKVDMVRFPGGYATIKDGAVTFHYYTQDYLGSNRAVVNGSTGAIEQTVAYYPYGSVIADLGTDSDRQPFKFGGKELTLQNGLNEYDFGARQYYPAVPHFTTVDPLCEKTPWLSPYLYCANNPVNLVDPDGMDWSIWSERDNENILNIHMQINGVVYNSFKNSIDVDKLSTEIKSQLEDVFSFSGDGYKVNLEANIRSVSDVNDIKETDHVFVIAKQEKIGKDNVLAKATTNGLTIKLGTTLANQIISGENTRSIAHELGHTGGLRHTDHPSSVQVNDKNANLMTQIKGLDSGVDYNHARNLQPNQLNVIIRNYNEGKLNVGSPVSKISHLRISSSFPFFHLHSNILNF